MLELETGLEPATSSLQGRCSTIELLQHVAARLLRVQAYSIIFSHRALKLM